MPASRSSLTTLIVNSTCRAGGRTHADFARHFNLKRRACGTYGRRAIFVSSRSCALLAGDGIRGAEPGARATGGARRRLRMVKRGGLVGRKACTRIF
jgi:hypothetical protein